MNLSPFFFNSITLVPPDIEFIAMGDPQPSLGRDSSRPPPLEWVIRDSIVHAVNNYPNATHLEMLGDLTNMPLITEPYTGDAPFMNQIFDNWTRDKYYVLGNHDVNDGPPISKATAFGYLMPSFQDRGGTLKMLGYGYEYRGNDLYVITMNSNQNSFYGFSLSPNYDGGVGGFGADQINWLRNTLNSITAPNARLVFITHYPLMTNNLPLAPSPPAPVNTPDKGFLHERTEMLQVIHLLTKWQALSDHGLITCILTGHTHRNGYWNFNGYWGNVDSYTFNDSMPDSGTYAGYTGSSTVVSSQTQFMQYGRVKFTKAINIFQIDGVGMQSSYGPFDLSSRITAPKVLYAGTEKPITGTLTVSGIGSPTTTTATFNCTATHSVGIVGFNVYSFITGNTAALNRIIYDTSISSFIIGQLVSGSQYNFYVTAFDEAGNISDPSNTVTFTAS